MDPTQNELELNPAPAPGPEAHPPAEPPPAFSRSELTRALFLPHRAIALILGERERLAATVAGGPELGLTVILLLLAATAFALPYGAFSAAGGAGKAAVLFTVSMLICFPSLYIFNQYVGTGLRLEQTLAAAALFSAAAGIMSFGFFPIAWFLDFSITDQGTGAVSFRWLSNFLLAVAFGLGLLQVGRCFVWSGPFLRIGPAPKLLLLAWSGLLGYITFRMALVLGL